MFVAQVGCQMNYLSSKALLSTRFAACSSAARTNDSVMERFFCHSTLYGATFSIDPFLSAIPSSSRPHQQQILNLFCLNRADYAESMQASKLPSLSKHGCMIPRYKPTQKHSAHLYRSYLKHVNCYSPILLDSFAFWNLWNL